MRLLGSLEDLQVGTVKAYALAIARNGFISRRRRKGRDSELPDGLLDRFPPPDVVAERNDDVRALLGAIQDLPDGERVAFLLRFQQEPPYDEIARILGTSLSAAKVRVHRARLKLAQVRSPCGEKS